MTLHTVNLLPDHADCQRCIGQLAPGDAVVFLGRGVWIASAGSAWWRHWERDAVDLYALADDLAATGLAGHRAAAVGVVDLSGLVALSEQHACQRAWF